jgi:hypothetical protein
MAETRPKTLLDFAIAASAAVVPVLLLVLLLVGVIRPLDPGAPAARNGERHVSVREVAALKTFERAIVRRDTVVVGPPTALLLLDRVPQCRSAWGGRGGVLDRVRAVLAPKDSASPSPAQRLADQLRDLDDELLHFSDRANRRVSEPVGFDAARWFEAVGEALQRPIEAPDYPGHKFTVQCADIASAAALLARANGRTLNMLSWRGTEVERVISRWHPEQFVEISPRQVARMNPWEGLPGCVFIGNAASGAGTPVPAYFVAGPHPAESQLCTRPEMFAAADDPGQAMPPKAIAGEATPDLPVNDERWKVPPSLGVMLQSLSTLRQPSGSLYNLYTDAAGPSDDTPIGYRYGPNRIDVGGAPVDVGFSIDLTIEPAVQALAQQAVSCYTGRQDVCRALGAARKEDAGHDLGHRMLERAVVRMAAVAVIDVATGRIEALAGALSPCTRQEYNGPGRAAGCDKRLPYTPRYRPDALLNAAVFYDAMPASVIKPIMAEAFLTDPDVGARWLAAERTGMRDSGTPTGESMRGQIMVSNSARFLDRMFCADKAFVHCDRPWRIQAMAGAFGWNSGCTPPRDDCGKRDLLFGRAVDVGANTEGVAPLATVVPYGRLLAEPVTGALAAPFHLRPPVTLDSAKVRACAAGPDGRWPSHDDWEKCSGGTVVDVVAEGWGQGHARASALGVAGMMAALAAAGNAQSEVHLPHLVSGLRGVSGEGSNSLELAVSRFGLADAVPNRLSPQAAEVILSGLSYGHRAGTSRLACEQVFDAHTCQEIDWIAGKTGTPTFPNDNRSLDELWRLCGHGAARGRADEAACGPLRPYKWYVAAYRTNQGDPRWTKVIGVLTERNWLRDTGRIHGAGDRGPNPAAEIALQIIGRQAGILPGYTE